MSLLELHNVTLRFGGLVAASTTSPSRWRKAKCLRSWARTALVSRPIFNMISRFYTPAEGEILYKGPEHP